jgi:hypothetical protein
MIRCLWGKIQKALNMAFPLTYKPNSPILSTTKKGIIIND